MRKINWKVRIKNKTFWITMIPVMVLLLKAVLSLMGFTTETYALEEWITQLIDAAFILLGIIGIVADPTTAGVTDSEQALTYEAPKEN